MEAQQRPTHSHAAVLSFLWTAMIIAFYTGAGMVATSNIGDQRGWERDCRQLNITICPQAPVCKWSTVKDRCESINGDGVLVSVTVIVCLLLLPIISAILRTKRDGSGRSIYTTEAFSHACMFACIGIGLVVFGFAIAFSDLIWMVVSLVILSLGVFAAYKAVGLIGERMTYRLLGPDEEVAGDEEYESSSGLFDQAVDFVRVGMRKPSLPAYDAVVGDAPDVDSPIYDHFVGSRATQPK